MQTISKRINSLQIIIFIICGIALGLSISKIGQLSNSYLMVALLGIAFPFIAFMIGDLRKFLIAALGATIPFRVDVNFYHLFENQAGAHTMGISLQDVFVIMILVVWIVESVLHKNGSVRGFKFLTIPIILYIEICILTLIWAPRIDLAMMEIVSMVKVFILYFVLANQIRDKQDLKLVVWGLVLAVGFQGALALMQTIKGGTIGLAFLGEAPIAGEVKESVWRVMGTLGHPNRLAMFLEILLPVCFGFFLVEKRGRNRIIVLASFGLGFLALVMTGSRGAWIAFFIAMIILFYFAVRHKLMKLSTLFGTALVFVILISSIALMFTKMIEARLYGDDHGSAMSRIPMIQIAFNLIKAHPYGGVGINNYQVVMKNYNNTILGRRFRTIPRPVHNMYLLVMGETGLIGFAAMLILLLGFGSNAIKNIRNEEPEVSIINAAIFAGFIAMCIHGLVDKHPPGSYELFYLLMALVASSRFSRERHSIIDRQDPI